MERQAGKAEPGGEKVIRRGEKGRDTTRGMPQVKDGRVCEESACTRVNNEKVEQTGRLISELVTAADSARKQIGSRRAARRATGVELLGLHGSRQEYNRRHIHMLCMLKGRVLYMPQVSMMELMWKL